MAKLYIGNLSGEVTDNGLQELFTGRGFQVTSARVICDREGGRICKSAKTESAPSAVKRKPDWSALDKLKLKK